MIMKGDVNLDYKINDVDLELIRAHILGFISLAGNSFIAADINNDGQVNGRDLARINAHRLGTNIITEIIN